MKNNEFKKTNTLILSRLIVINRTPTSLNKETCKPMLFKLKKRMKNRGLTIEQNLQIKEGNIYLMRLNQIVFRCIMALLTIRNRV